LIKQLFSWEAVRFGLSLLDGFSHPYTFDESAGLLSQGAKDRTKNFLSLCEREIFSRQRFPYFELIRSAGFTWDGLRSLVETRGLEPALARLAEAGVYLDIEEFKGKKSVIRGDLRFRLDNSLLDMARGPAVPLESSGSSGPRMRTPMGLDGLKLQASFLPVLLRASGASDLPVVLYYPMPSTPGIVHLLAFTLAGMPPAALFSQVSDSQSRRSDVGKKLGALVAAARLRGLRLPLPRFADVRHPKEMAAWLSRNCTRGACIASFPGSALHLLRAAKAENINLPPLAFILGGEPTTARKRAALEADGHRVIPWYGTVEHGRISVGCLSPSVSDDMHLLSDRLAIVKRKFDGGRPSHTIEPFLFTSLSPAAHKLLINVENGDTGSLEDRRCGCSWESIGLKTHLHSIQSFEKLNMEGMTFDAVALAELVEESLPAVCGGTPADYQFAEEEDRDGLTRLVVSVSPAVEVEEDELKELVLKALYASKPTLTPMTEVIDRAGTIVVRREHPRPASSGKINPLRRKSG
jgi:hypothetical protein